MAWSDERVAVLKKMWLDGNSASEIAKELGNITRNAVIGKVHRKLSRENTLKVVSDLSEETLKDLLKVEMKSKKISLMDLTEKTCKWPIGDPATNTFWFCGHEAEPGKPYCKTHISIAFQPITQRRSRKENS